MRNRFEIAYKEILHKAGRRVLAVCFLLSVACSSAFSQLFTFNDPNFRDRIKDSLPSLMVGDQLNISAANNYNGYLDLSNAQITDLRGIENFFNIYMLKVNNNNLTGLADISKLTSLKYLYAYSNQLTSLPDLSQLVNLTDLQVQDNQLESMPPLDGLPSLIYIYCQNNKIKSIPGLTTLMNLQILVAGGNPLNTLPDLSPLYNLRQLHVQQTGIDTLIGLSALINLEELHAWGNNLRDLSGISSNTKLKNFNVWGNKLTSLPTLSNKPLTNVSIDFNNLTFEDIIPLTGLQTFNNFHYTPQKPVLFPDKSVREKAAFVYDAGIDKNVSGSTYSWYKNGNLLQKTASGSITITPSMIASDTGNYTFTVVNPALPALILQSTVSKASLLPCFEISGYTVNTLSESCAKGKNISFASVNLKGGLGPFTYKIVSTISNDTILPSAGVYEALIPGIYRLAVTDSRGCKAFKELTIEPIEGCDQVFSPNMDGISDNYFIPEKGRARIYDLKNRLIKELEVPGAWDGTTMDGNLADDGYYAIVINEKQVLHVTLIK